MFERLGPSGTGGGIINVGSQCSVEIRLVTQLDTLAGDGTLIGDDEMRIGFCSVFEACGWPTAFSE